MPSGENILHFTGVRMRLLGNGLLKMSLKALNDLDESTLVPFTMKAQNDRFVTRLCNYSKQRVMFEVKTTEINEVFTISQIILFAKEIYTSYPGTE